MQEIPPEGKWKGGYIRVIDPEVIGFGTGQPSRTHASIYEYPSDHVLEWGNPPPEEISITNILRSATLTSDGEYNYNDFDYDRYAGVMVDYLN